MSDDSCERHLCSVAGSVWVCSVAGSMWVCSVAGSMWVCSVAGIVWVSGRGHARAPHEIPDRCRLLLGFPGRARLIIMNWQAVWLPARQCLARPWAVLLAWATATIHE
eukprot:360117-Chlamydomonas_euryale.AAC.9